MEPHPEPCCIAAFTDQGGRFHAAVKVAGAQLLIGGEDADLVVCGEAPETLTVVWRDGHLVLERWRDGEAGIPSLLDSRLLEAGDADTELGSVRITITILAEDSAPAGSGEALDLARAWAMHMTGSPDGLTPRPAASNRKFIMRVRPPRARMGQPDEAATAAPEAHSAPVPGIAEPPQAPPAPAPAAELSPFEFEDLLGRNMGGSKVFAKDALGSTEAERDPVPLPPWRRGTALFRVPRMMWTETAELAELRLAAGGPLAAAMQAALEKSMVGRGTRTDSHDVACIGRRMQARLLGDDRYFRVDPLSSEAQDITGDTAGWDWRIVPLREGHSLLTLRLSMLADLDGRDLAVDAEALHTSVEITVKSVWTRPTRFVRDNWRWMLGGSGIGAVAAVWALIAS